MVCVGYSAVNSICCSCSRCDPWHASYYLYLARQAETASLAGAVRSDAANTHTQIERIANDIAGRSEAADARVWYEIAEEAKVQVTLPDGSTRRPLLYEARHTAATLLLASGTDETTIKHSRQFPFSFSESFSTSSRVGWTTFEKVSFSRNRLSLFLLPKI